MIIRFFTPLLVDRRPFLCRCHSLTYLSVCFCEHISEAGVELLGQTHSLISLDISGCNCGDQVKPPHDPKLTILSRRSGVFNVHISGCNCGDQVKRPQDSKLRILSRTSGQVRSECLTCTFRARLSRAQVPASKKRKRGGGRE